MQNSAIIRIQTETSQARLSPAQKKFNSLIKRIDAQKKLLVEWQTSLARCRQEALTQLEPLKNRLAALQEELVLLLDNLLDTQKFTHNQQTKLSHLICGLSAELIDQHGRDDLKPLYNKRSGSDFDVQTQQAHEQSAAHLKAMLENTLGIDLAHEGFDFNPNDLPGSTERLAEWLYQRQQQQTGATNAKPARKKSAKQIEKERREHEEAMQVSKSIQAVYRQLVAALHPDREPDPTERARKTELMQKVTVAYTNKDLLQLLELQWAVEQIDQARLNNTPDDKVKRYNKILQTQLDELREEVELLEMQVRAMLQIAPFERLSPKRISEMLKYYIYITREAIETLTYDLQRFQDVRQLKQWLRSYRIFEADIDPFA